MSKRSKWFTIGFLGVTGLAIITEVIFAFDGVEDTRPWTDLIVDYIPWEVGLAAFGALLLWIPIHFYVRYRRKEAAKQSNFLAEYGYHSLTYCPDRTVCPLHRPYRRANE